MSSIIGAKEALSQMFDSRGLPAKNPMQSGNLEGFRRQLRILDEQQAVNRYKWYNVYPGLNAQLIERILYYKYQACLFFSKEDGKFYFLPFALSTEDTGNGYGIDCYGRFNSVTPLPAFGGSVNDKGEIKPWIPGYNKKVIKEIPDAVSLSDFENGCVILKDYTPQMAETGTPRQQIQEPLLTQMSEIFPIVRTNLYANSGVKAMRVGSEDEKDNVANANAMIARHAINGEYLVPIVGSVEFQELSSTGSSQSQEMLMGLQSLDNYRLSLYGLKNGGIFEKAGSYVNDTQAGNIQQNCGLQYQDGLTLRQQFCNIANAVWGGSMWCDASEVVQNVDQNMDGAIADEEEPISGGEDNDI